MQITRFGCPLLLDTAEPETGNGKKLYDVSTAGSAFADTHRLASAD